uniref:Uncharacterized protein n=1 Tax=viral metagenome TaxID=1070528 RepID=A0A6C0J9P6_9ZZZZ
MDFRFIILSTLLCISNVSSMSVDIVCRTCQTITNAEGAYDDCFNDVNNSYSWCQRIYNLIYS